MALFFRDDDYDLASRQYGFKRYRQLLSFYGFHWWKVNLITLAGLLPIAAAIAVSVSFSSFVVLVPATLVCGAVSGPFLSTMYDAVMRGLRDAPEHWWTNYKKAFKQNLKPSAAAGAVFGFIAGLYAFMLYMIFTVETMQKTTVIIFYLVGLFIFILINTLFWPQLVLLELPLRDMVRNSILFTAKYLWRVFLSGAVQLAYWALIFLFAPWSFFLMPLTGFWYIIFLSEFMIYDQLSDELMIDKRYHEIEGDPFKDPFEEEDAGDLEEPGLGYNQDISDP